MDPVQLASAITPKTKAIVPVHLFGQAVNIDEIQKIAKEHNIPVVEDACQAHGATYGGKMVGSHAQISCFSFYPTKNLGTYGDGGAILTDDEHLFEQCKLYRNYGQKTRYDHQIKGLNSRLDELHAAILRAKLPHLKTWIVKRNELAALYTKRLTGIEALTLPKVRDNAGHSYHLYVIETPRREELKAYLHTHGVESIIHYPIPIHKQKCYEEFNDQTLPRTEEAARQLLSLPIHPFMTEDEVESICKTIITFFTTN